MSRGGIHCINITQVGDYTFIAKVFQRRVSKVKVNTLIQDGKFLLENDRIEEARAKLMEAIKSRSFFTRFAKATSRAAGKPAAFLIALAIILAWIATGPMFGFSDTWQLVINTGTTIITFLMVFLIQSTQNRDSEAVQRLWRRSKG